MEEKKIYNPTEFEAQMRELWKKEQVYITNDQRPTTNDQKAFCLSMFPYPSAAGLHVGHVRIYTGTDVMARYFKMMGKDVLHPMGWDAFGLPAENAAIKAKKNPIDMVPGNIANFKKQMNMLGLSYDWDKELSTADPSYYKWTQWLFIQFFKMGLLYKKNTPIHFCPKCKTGLSEEEVLANGTHERCGSVIEKKELPQWIFRITTYAERLLEDLKLLDWPKGILEMQKNWIGKKDGVDVTFQLVSIDSAAALLPNSAPSQNESPRVSGSPSVRTTYQNDNIICFTTRIDTIFGVVAVVVAPEHPFACEVAEKNADVKKYIEKSQNKSAMDREDTTKKKTGVITNEYVLHPFTGKKIPVWVGDYVLGSVGTGAVMVVPAHDLRDYDFAKMYGLDIISVVVSQKGEKPGKNKVFENDGILVDSDKYSNLTSSDARETIIRDLEDQNKGKKTISYHLRDWIFSRQRYWGEPIPMVFCEQCAKNGQGGLSHPDPTMSGKDLDANASQKHASLDSSPALQVQNDNMMKGWFPILESQLPLELPYAKSYEPTETGESPLSAIPEFVNTICPMCGGKAKRETDTMPNWAGSCWYFIRFAMQNENDKLQMSNVKSNSSSKFNNLKEEWMQTMAHSPWAPVDWYLGGAEHAVLHLLYARFWVKALYDLKLLNYPEPFLRLRNVGMVLAEDHRKMSKSFGNTINPDDVVAAYGADTLRMYEMFMAPFNMEIAWSTAALQGGHRFLKRVWNLYINQKSNIKNQKSDPELVDKLNKTIQKVGDDIVQTKFNTAIAAMMEFLNTYEKAVDSRESLVVGLNREEAKKFIQILAPFAPFITEKIWRDVFNEKTSIHLSSWPVQTTVSIKNTVVKLPIQIQGKFRGVVLLPTGSLEENDVEAAVLKDEALTKYISGKQYKLIYVKGKICNFVLS